MPSETVTAKQVGIVYFGGLLAVSLMLVIYNAITSAGWSLWWQFGPLWIGWLFTMVVGQITMIVKFFRFKYWK